MSAVSLLPSLAGATPSFLYPFAYKPLPATMENATADESTDRRLD